MSAETLIKALMHRRVPQILGLYLGGAWVAIEFSNMIAQRFALSQTLVDFLLVLLASFVPTVLMLAGVRVGGTPYLPTRFRWGYGWPFFRGYQPLNADELKQIETLNQIRRDISPQTSTK